MYCRNCGRKLEDDTKEICADCEAKLNTEPVQDEKIEVVEEVKNESGNENTTTTSSNVVKEPKSRIAAGLLGVFLGTFGIHNFYLGYTGKAVAQLLITVLSCGCLSFVSYIWGFIEGIVILTGEIKVDGQGTPLRD